MLDKIVEKIINPIFNDSNKSKVNCNKKKKA